MTYSPCYPPAGQVLYSPERAERRRKESLWGIHLAPAGLGELECSVPGGFATPGQTDALQDRSYDSMEPKWEAFRRQGGRLIEAPDQVELGRCVDERRHCAWSLGIRPGDFVIPVCHQGMNRSQILRLALLGTVRKLNSSPARSALRSAPSTESGERWVSRAHGAVSGCDAFTAYGADVNEMNFFGYLHDSGEIFLQPTTQSPTKIRRKGRCSAGS
jgi:hypothetical protein